MPVFLLPLVFLLSSLDLRPAPIVLTGYFACRSSALAGTDDGLVCYAKTQGACRNGTLVLAYEQRVRPAQGRPRYDILDTIHLRVAEPHREVDITSCATATGRPRQYFVLYRRVAAAEKRYLPYPRRAWGVNAQGHLVEVLVKTLHCLNNDYGAF